MIFMCAQPATLYYAWQVEVMINNFLKNGVDPNNIQIVSSLGNVKLVPFFWKQLTKRFKNIKFFFYQDDRPLRKYIPSIRPYILSKHWESHPELENEVIFYHDSDIILTKPFSFGHLEDDDQCYVADTVSYIGAKYILSKGEKYLDIMTQIVGVDKETVIKNEKDSGGAQYVLKGIDAGFWKEMYNNVEKMYSSVNKEIVKDKEINPRHHEIQIWCADMWCLLWGLWKRNKTVRVVPELSFSWATSTVNDWEKHPIFHNAGVTNDKQGLFYKAKYIREVPYKSLKIKDFDPKRCSFKYVEELIETGKNSCLLF